MQGKLRLHKRHFAQSVRGLAIALVLSAAGGAAAMTLQEAVEYTVTTNPEIDEARANREAIDRSEEHTSELQSLMHISYAVFCLKKKHTIQTTSCSICPAIT